MPRASPRAGTRSSSSPAARTASASSPGGPSGPTASRRASSRPTSPPTRAWPPAATPIDAGPPLGLAILNAGFGDHGPVHAADRERLAAMVRLNCVAVVDLAAHVAARDGRPRRRRARGHELRRRVAAGAVHGDLRRDEGLRAAPHRGHRRRAPRHRRAGARGVPRADPHRVLPAPPGPAARTGRSRSTTRISWSAPRGGRWRTAARGRPTGLVARGSMLASRLLPRRLIVRGAGAHPPDVRSLKGSDGPHLECFRAEGPPP